MQKITTIIFLFLIAGCGPKSYSYWKSLPIPIVATNQHERDVLNQFNDDFGVEVFHEVDVLEKDSAGNPIGVEFRYDPDQIRVFNRRAHTVSYKTPYITHAVIEADSIFLGPQQFSPSLECILIHELGHAIGYNKHDDNSEGDEDSIMSSPLTRRICKKDPEIYFEKIRTWFFKTYPQR